MVKVHGHLRAVMLMGQKARKTRCRMRGSNPRPSVYKTHYPVPLWADLRAFLRNALRVYPIISGFYQVQRCKVHLRAVVHSIHTQFGPVCAYATHPALTTIA